MDPLNTILQEASQLLPEDKKKLIQQLQAQLAEEPFKQQLVTFKGIAKGVWEQDAQEYVNALREER